ncbi:hypothetical protein OPKNFCMD_5162 [Methylobacterium crusticola]|uniref:DUF2190 family protein n=1 Tax=Methylobacterium crusticola TaxID=1697972 RepID=A0ABQ4R4N1_9HYPH|nr:DUF2190 family protein [Methylobacterium crusticola]GJD52397.1 hypothetical protein OPKNFCMD_5162 [Methylobacterium crusticola]
MPPVQTTYPGRPGPAYEGMLAGQEPAGIVSRTVETPEGIGFGKPAFQGARDDGIAAAGAVFRGIVLVDHNVRPSGAGDAFAKGETAPVLVRGVVWVAVSGTVAAGAPAFLTPAGAVTAAAAGNTPMPDAHFDSSAAAGGLARLRLS